MALILTQTNIVAPCGTILACASPADGLATTPQARKAEEGGIAGGNELSVIINKGDIQAGVMFESPAVGQTTWQAGTYTVRLNVTTAVADLLLTEVHVCRVNSSCVNQESIGSETGLSISMGSTGVKTVEVTGVEQSAADTDRIYIVIVFEQTSHASAVFGFTPDQDIDTPIEAAQEFVYAGDVPVAILPDDPKAILSKSYAGDVPLTALPSYTSILDRVYAGAVPMVVLPAAPTAPLEKAYAGAIGLVLVPNSAYELVVEYAYTGDLAMGIVPSYMSILDRIYGGDISLAALPGYSSIFDRVYAGAVLMSILPDFPKAILEKSYSGDIGFVLLPNSIYELVEAEANEFVYAGDIPLIALPSYNSILDRVYQGSIPLSILPSFPIALLGKSYFGNLPLSITPDTIKALLEKSYYADISLAVMVDSLYSLEALLEFVYIGDIPLSVLSGHSSALDMIYGGDIGLAVIPTSAYGLEAFIEVVKTVFLKSKLTERLVELKSTIKPSIVLNSEIKPEGEN